MRRDHGRHAAQRDLGVVRLARQGKDHVGGAVVVVEEDEQGRAGSAAVGAPMHARRETSATASASTRPRRAWRAPPRSTARCCSSSQISIGAWRGTTPSVSGRLIFRWRSAMIGSSTPISPAASFSIGPAASTRCVASSVCRSPCCCTWTARTLPPPLSTPTTLPRTSRTPLRSRRLQHGHAELLGAQPAGAPRMQHRHGLGREIGKVPADRASVGDDIRPGERRRPPATACRRSTPSRETSRGRCPAPRPTGPAPAARQSCRDRRWRTGSRAG